MTPVKYYTVDSHHPQLHAVIDGALRLQSQLVVTRAQARADRGFLISKFTPQETLGLFERRSARLVVCEDKSDMLGYVLTTGMSELTDLYSGDSVGRLNLARDVDFSGFRY